MNADEERLKELGLWPVWRQRPGAAFAGVPAASQACAPAQVEAPIAALAADPIVPETETPIAAEVDAPPPLAAPSSVEISPPRAEAPALDGRHARIARMTWDELRQGILECSACPLHRTRTQGVPGVGDRAAEWLFVGEAPGAEEDARGEPFVGQAGRLLDNMLAALGLKRGNNVYIANVLKSRPPGNRNPLPDEIEQCLPYLRRQIELIQPAIIVALGKFAAQTLLLSDAPIGALRGRVHNYQGVPLVATYHPAYLLRNLPDKAKAWQDLCLARATVEARRTPPGESANLNLEGPV